MTDITDLVKYEVPILRHIIHEYENIGYSHANAEQLAVEYYSQELREAYEKGISPELELLIIDKRFKFRGADK